jgi:hypothetical protein
MNCKQIQELLPLYVGRDLEEKRTRLIATHLESCKECAGSAAEYEETYRLLQGFAPPTFSEATFDGIRRQVWREIEREEATQSLPQLIAGLFRPRLSWAVATAVLAAVSLFAFYFIANRANERREFAQVQPAESPTQKPKEHASNSPLPASQENNASLIKDADRNRGSETAMKGAGDNKPPTQRRRRLGAVADRQAVAVITPDRKGVEPSPQANNPGESDASPQDPGGSQKMLRVEMQTKDPNIRIIWFSHQRPKQDSPGKFSKGV